MTIIPGARIRWNDGTIGLLHASGQEVKCGILLWHLSNTVRLLSSQRAARGIFRESPVIKYLAMERQKPANVVNAGPAGIRARSYVQSDAAALGIQTLAPPLFPLAIVWIE